MIDELKLQKALREVLAELGYQIEDPPGSSDHAPRRPRDITSAEARAEILIPNPFDREALERMKQKTNARIGVWRAGARLGTQTMLTLRADHAAARDAVFTDVDPAFLERLGLFTVQTRCADKNDYLTRPDHGRLLNDEAAETLRRRCVMNPDIQIFASDGLSSSAIAANLADVLPLLLDGLKAKGVIVGTPFFVKFGRVGAMDHISEILGSKVTCVLLGERPGLATAESMSAYIAYNARVGMPESRRTVVSNIHRAGIPAVEAGAYIADLLVTILNAKTSGVELRREEK
ncbi:MAG TPA: ethanolamine ammonia-lyase subunit EutC [Candidatus Fimivivens faecavium]|nr:ethanolamine ammonia-lyase subunit EutC [Candidatus Fimivivens faecavium]